jgi:hypothetical protein
MAPFDFALHFVRTEERGADNLNAENANQCRERPFEAPVFGFRFSSRRQASAVM